MGATNEPSAAGNADYRGAVYVFTRSGATWSQQGRIVPADLQPNDQFGSSVAVASDSFIAGSSEHDTASPPPTNSGAAWVFVRSGTTWSQQVKLRPPDLANYHSFGRAVAITDGTAAVVSQLATYVFGRVRPNGEACTSGVECSSGFCADGVCCDKPCNAKCEACVAAKNGGSALQPGGASLVSTSRSRPAGRANRHSR